MDEREFIHHVKNISDGICAIDRRLFQGKLGFVLIAVEREPGLDKQICFNITSNLGNQDEVRDAVTEAYNLLTPKEKLQ